MNEVVPETKRPARETAKRISTTRMLNERLPLAPPELEVIGAFIHFARVTGIPRSTAEIFGLLFVSADPMPSDEVINRLNLSAGAASQGLRQLKEMGAVRSVYVAGDRRDHFAVETGSGVATAFFRAQIRNYAANGAERLQRLSSLVQADETQSFASIGLLRERVQILLDWHGQITKLAGLEAEVEERPDPPAPLQRRVRPATRLLRRAPTQSESVLSGDGCPVS